jgi:hypothetical protein
VSELPALADHRFWDPILVDCPACGNMALVRLEEPGESWDQRAFGARRMTCTACGAARFQPRTPLSRPAMGLALRLVGEGRLGTLHAWNEAHLDHIEAYVRAPLRRERVEPGGPRNATILSRLPAWVKSAANRAEILRLIARMRARLG